MAPDPKPDPPPATSHVAWWLDRARRCQTLEGPGSLAWELQGLNGSPALDSWDPGPCAVLPVPTYDLGPDCPPHGTGVSPSPARKPLSSQNLGPGLISLNPASQGPQPSGERFTLHGGGRPHMPPKKTSLGQEIVGSAFQRCLKRFPANKIRQSQMGNQKQKWDHGPCFITEDSFPPFGSSRDTTGFLVL